MLQGRSVVIYGDGETTRDFCYIANVVQANLLAATASDANAVGQVYNVALGGRLSLNSVFETLRRLLEQRHPGLHVAAPIHEDFRPGDIRHSQADIGKAHRLLGYEPLHDVQTGLEEALPWYESRLRRLHAGRLAEVQRDDVA